MYFRQEFNAEFALTLKGGRVVWCKTREARVESDVCRTLLQG